jgi:hypothetical protein
MRIPLVSNKVVRASNGVVVVGLLFSASAEASSINWGPVENITGPGTSTVTTTKTDGGPGSGVTITDGTNDVVKEGTMVLGISFCGQPGSTFPYTTTIAGQNFYSFVDLPGPSGSPSYPVTFSTPDMTNSYTGYTPGTAGESYGVFYTNGGGGPAQDYLLANALFSNSNTGTIILGNLTPGDDYLMQFWVSDPRNSVTQTRVESLASSSGGDTNAPTLDYEAPGSTDGQWVTGTFVADSSETEQLDLSASNSNPSTGDAGSPQVNLFQLRDITNVLPPQWTTNGSGDWNDPNNWSTVVPNAVGAEADFFGAITSNHTVYTDQPITLGTINFNNADTYVLTGSSTLTLQTSSGHAQVIVQNGTQEINLPTTVASNTVFNISAGANLVIANPLTIDSGISLTQTGSGTVTYQSIINVESNASIAFQSATHAHALNLASGSTATVATHSIEVDSLSNLGTLNVENNEVIINYGSGADPIAAVSAEIKSGYAGGAWTGAGINSSSAAANNATPGNLLYGLGYADAADPGNPAGLASGTIEIKYTLLGDANLSGVVDGTDFGILAANFNKGVTGWDQGDFNYNNVVDGTDFGFLAANFNKGASGASVGGSALTDPALVAFAEANGLMADVPEPASIAGLALGAGVLLGRRRAKR